MRATPWIAALLLLPALAWAEDVDAFKRRFEPQEQIILSAVLADPSARAEFARDAQRPDAAALTKWRAKAALYAKDYLSKQHPSRYTDAQGRPIRDLKDTVEPGEWAALMYTLELMATGDAVQRGKMKIFIGMIKGADAALKTDDSDRTEQAVDVIDLGRGQFREALTEYSASETANRAIADYERARAAADQAALEQARQAEEAARRARTAPTPERAANETGIVTDGQPVQPPPPVTVVEEETGTEGSPEIAGGLPPLPPSMGLGRNSHTANPPPSPGGSLDDLSRLDTLDKQAGDPFAAYAIGGGAALGLIAGGLAAGPLGLGLVAGILLGGLLGGLLGWGVKKLFLS